MSLYKDASLVMIPSAYKDGKLYSIRPTDGSGDFTFSRGSNLAATRVDVNGLIEKGKENLLLQSNQFDTTWSSVGTTETGGQAGYDGSNDAWEISKGASQYRRIAQSISSSGVQTLSVYAKANTQDVISFLCSSTSGDAGGVFNLSTETWVTNFNTIDFGNESIGNGWHRVYVTFNRDIVDVRIYVGWNDSDAGSIYIQDAQLEAGLVATDYIETGASTAQAGILEDMPRLDYSGSCPALLLEPQRTNLLSHSEYFGGWNKVNQGTGSAPVLSIDGDFPLGDGKYYNLQCNLNGGTTSSDRSYISLGGLSATQFTAAKSIWIKNNSASEAVLFMGINFSADKFTLAANADWQRITIDGGVINSEFRIGLGGGSSQSDTIDVSIFGAQCEAGSYPTSYIPTYGSSVTRNKDLCDLDNMNTSGISTSNNWTYFIDIENFYSGDAFWYLNSTSGDLAFVYSSSFGYRNTSNSAVYPSSWSFSPYNRNNTRLKMALRYDGSKLVVFMNGEKKSDEIDSSLLSSRFNDPLKQDRYRWTGNGKVDTHQKLIFDTALTDSECIALTTL